MRNLRKERIGVVTSNKMDKSIVVSVVRKEKHPLYGKFVMKTSKFTAHDEKNDCNSGDTVKIMETRPIKLQLRCSQGAIAHGVLVAQELGVPFVYVRASAKEHGRKNLIEGKVESGQSVVVIEDLVSSGKSSLAAVQALRDGGFKVNGMGAIFSYGFEHAKKSFEEANCDLFTLGDYDTLIDQALETKYITKDDVEMLKVWREDPSIWNK